MVSGRLSQILGEKALNLDKFSLFAGYRKAAQEAWDDPETLTQEERDLL